MADTSELLRLCELASVGFDDFPSDRVPNTVKIARALKSRLQAEAPEDQKDERDRAREVAEQIVDGFQNTLRNALLEFAETDWNDGFGKGLARGMKAAKNTLRTSQAEAQAPAVLTADQAERVAQIRDWYEGVRMDSLDRSHINELLNIIKDRLAPGNV